jgi:very-short-patch-repair endonuclease
LSRGEEKLYDLLKHCFPGKEIIREYTFSNGLRLDFYIPELNVAWEVDGAQHQQWTEHFHKTKSDYYIAQNRDEQKEYICEGLGINLIRIPSEEKLTPQSPYLFPRRGSGEIKPGFEKYLPRVVAKQTEKAARKSRYADYKQSDAYQKRKEKAREYRQRRYRELKAKS